MIYSKRSDTYFELSCILPAVWEELWSWFCFEKGALGVQTFEETKFKKTLKIFFETKPVGGGKMLVECFRREISKEICITILKESVRPNEKWIEKWHANFKPIKIGKTLVVLPSWENDKYFPSRDPVWIEPGQSFGTGHHISTILALESLEKFLLISDFLPELMIDIGIGSGILSIAACRLGVEKVAGVDIDKKAVEEVKKNIKLNRLFGRINAIHGNPSLLKNRASLVICNMLLSEILDVMHEIQRLTNPGGTLICSGLLNKQGHELIRILSKTGFDFCSILKREEWCAIKFKNVSN